MKVIKVKKADKTEFKKFGLGYAVIEREDGQKWRFSSIMQPPKFPFEGPLYAQKNFLNHVKNVAKYVEEAMDFMQKENQ